MPSDFLEPATLSVAQVREAIRRAAWPELPRPSQDMGEPSNALLGRMFHATFAELLSADPMRQWQAALDPETLGDHQRLNQHVYDKLLGPRITAQQALLQERAPQALNLWHATQQMSDWLCGLLEAAHKAKLIGFDRSEQKWTGTENLCMVEQPVTWTLREPEWTRPVQVTGVPDVVWRNPQSGKWCVVEFKLGRTQPEADAAQAVLYHMLLAAGGLIPADAPGAMAVVTFLPDRDERLYEGVKLAEAEKQLKLLIGRLAGVLPGQALASFMLGPAPVKEDHDELGEKLVKALEQYGPIVELRGSPIAGPSFLRYTIMPGKGVKVASILDKAQDLQIRLGLEHAPMIQKAGGKLVIDIQRPDRQPVLFSDLRSQLPGAHDFASRGKVILGVDLFNRLQFADLTRTPHLLVAGTSGSGKTEWLRTAVAGLTACNTPETLRLVLIDPKRSAFTDWKESPFLLDQGALLTPPDHSAIDLLETLIAEMEARYRLFESHRVADLGDYILKVGEGKPRIVCLCDEYADLVADRKERRQVEERIRRLGAKARAAGIHLIVATQYPRADIVDGALKANLPGRVCLRTTTYVQSNVVLGQSGAERLLGNGDLFWLDIGDPVRLQGVYLDVSEREPEIAGSGTGAGRG